MNAKEYINSGIVESYVLGLATDAERQEFERVCAEHPEVAEARDAFERLLEAQLMKDAEAPPDFVKNRITAAIGPATTGTTSEETRPEAPVRRLNVWKWVAAASLLLLAGAVYWAYSANEKYKALAERQAATERTLAQRSGELDSLYAEARVMRSPDVKMVKMPGTPNAPAALTTVFWDSTNKDVYLFVNNLP